MTQQDDITQRVLTDDEINTAIDWPAANTTMRAENDRAMAREVEAAVLRKLSKLRAPVADERAAFEAWVKAQHPDAPSMLWRVDDTYAYSASEWKAWQARAALASAPVADASIKQALKLVDELRKSAFAKGVCPDSGACHHNCVSQCARQHDLGCVPLGVSGLGDDWKLDIERGESAPVAGEQPYPAMPEPDVSHPGEQEDSYSRAAVETAMRAAHDRGYSVGWDHGKEHASAPVAGEAHRPLGHVAVLHSPCGARYFSRITSQHQAQVCAARWAKEYANVKPGPWPTEAVAVYAAPQASTPVGDERAVQEYGSPADVAQRIEQYLAQDGRMNSGTQLLYEAMKALRASQGDRNDG